MKKEVEVCDNCQEEDATYRIVKGHDKGAVFCEDCLEGWKEIEISDYYEDVDKALQQKSGT